MKVSDLTIRPYTDDDQDEVLDVLDASLGGGPAGRRPPEFFRWKHITNPFGRSFMIVAVLDDRIVGFRSFMRWRFVSGDRILRGVRAVDTATHPDVQGKGVFQRLTLDAIEVLRAEGVDFVFNTPNEASLKGYLKMGWRVIGQVPIAIRVKKPLRFVTRFRSKGEAGAGPAVRAPLAADVLSARGVDELLARAAVNDERIHTVRDAGYLRWRYADAPLLGYRAVSSHVGDSVTGLAIFRVRPREALWEATVSELIVAPGDRANARRLLHAVVKAADVDHLSTHFSPGTTGAAVARRSGFLPAPRGLTFVCNPLAATVLPDPTNLDSWSLSIGDLEVF